MSKPLLSRLKGSSEGRMPVWLMRQAGRYLPEYRALRKKAANFLEFCYTPDLAVEVTLQPIRRYGLDGAILFSDILVIPDALGHSVTFVQGEGPKLGMFRTEGDLERLEMERLESHLAPVFETLRRLDAELPSEVTLLGFAGAPWTIAAYMVEGGGSKDFATARTMAREDPALFARLIEVIVEATTRYLSLQIGAGAQAVQIFDSWAGVLSPSERERWCLEPCRQIISRLKEKHPDTPILLFPRGVGPAYELFAERSGADALSLDTTIPPEWAAHHLLGEGKARCLQGNLDPIALLGDRDLLFNDVARILDAARGRPWIFNLGHGVLQQTNPQVVGDLIRHLHSASS